MTRKNANAGASKKGRPTVDPDRTRSQRVVTFVTEWEMEGLRAKCDEEDRSLSGVVHRIISQHLQGAE